LLVVAGPSGVGKGTVTRRLLERDPKIWLSISMTTRPPRDGEVDGVDYRFVSRDEFTRLQARNGFLESFDVYGDLYGTPRGPLDEQRAAGRDVLLEVDVQGALRVREQIPEALLVFVKAPSRTEQEQRLRRRGQDSEARIARRLAEAEVEEALADRFDVVIVNDDADRAANELAAILADARRARAD
jgi:guanylate kinase